MLRTHWTVCYLTCILMYVCEHTGRWGSAFCWFSWSSLSFSEFFWVLMSWSLCHLDKWSEFMSMACMTSCHVLYMLICVEFVHYVWGSIYLILWNCMAVFLDVLVPRNKCTHMADIETHWWLPCEVWGLCFALWCAWQVGAWWIAFGPSFKGPSWTSHDIMWSSLWTPYKGDNVDPW